MSDLIIAANRAVEVPSRCDGSATPLYNGGVMWMDLTPDDFVQVECACGHTVADCCDADYRKHGSPEQMKGPVARLFIPLVLA